MAEVRLPPLAEALRPKLIAEVVGQDHLLAAGMPLSKACWSRQPHSMIFWGPPGVGKTTLAHLLAKEIGGRFVTLSAVLSGACEIGAVVVAAMAARAAGQRTLLFLDEIHHCTRPQHALLLPAVRSGAIILIGATTENPSFTVARQLLALTRVHVLKALNDEDLRRLLTRAQAWISVALSTGAVAVLIGQADGDGRRCLNLLEQAVLAARLAGVETITEAIVQGTLSSRARRFDKNGENFYDQISALHKSVRGSHPDAALYWLCRMLDGGVDPRYLIRRITSMAWDDIGLADPHAIHIVEAAAATWERLRSPDGDLALAQAVIYLSVAPKCNAGPKAFSRTMAVVRTQSEHPAQ